METNGRTDDERGERTDHEVRQETTTKGREQDGREEEERRDDVRCPTKCKSARFFLLIFFIFM